jgi:hypothetical protein
LADEHAGSCGGKTGSHLSCVAISRRNV